MIQRAMAGCRFLLSLAVFSGLATVVASATAHPAAKKKTHSAAETAIVVHPATHSTAHLAVRSTATRAAAGKTAHTAVAHAVVKSGSATHIATTHLVRTSGGKMVRVPVHLRGERFYASSFADNLTEGDITAGEDPLVREAAIQALGNMNGTALAIDPATGRILAMVNQKLALSSGAEPCSTIKLTVALAALQEGLIKRDTPVDLGGGYKVDLTYALAKSVNPFFEVLGRAMGFERVKHYANQLGLGELAGYNIAGEQLGVYPNEELPQAMGGVGRMCSFGESVSMTPLQLGAIVSAIANGGTLYYLQHPLTTDDVTTFQPKVKRTLDISGVIPEMLPGMQDAVVARWGTARSLQANFREFPVFGKTGTCSNNGTRFGWFGSYSDTPNGRIVTVIFLEGGRSTFGPKAAELTGQFYRALYEKNYFAPKAAAAPVVDGGN